MSPRHDRRRLLYADDSASEESDSGDDTPLRAAGDRSGGTSMRERRPHDLLPASYLGIAIISAASLLAVGAIVMGHVWAESLAGLLRPGDTAVLELSAVRNLSQWFASLQLALSSLVAISIFQLRRYRIDDYHGRYRMWIWMAMACLLASLGETTDGVLLADGLCRLASSPLGAPEALVWPMLLGLVLVTLTVRMFLEVRVCPAAVAALTVTVAMLFFAAAIDVGWVIDLSHTAKPLVSRGCWMVGHVMILATFLLYSRHVLLELEGVIVRPARKKRAKSKKASKSESKSESSKGDAHPLPAPHFRIDLEMLPPSSGGSGSANARVTSGAAKDSDGGRQLSKAERRKMRRESGNN